MIRFVLSPDRVVTPDLKAVLPGRGVWVTAEYAMVAQAVRKNAFQRAFRMPVHAAPDLAERVAGLLRDSALQALSMARKAGAVVTGFVKVENALARDEVIAVLRSRDAAPDGARKIAAAICRRFGDGRAIPTIEAFTTTQIDLALGRSNVIHAAILNSGAGAAFVRKAMRHVAFGDRCDTAPR